jgi:hypothetical protein
VRSSTSSGTEALPADGLARAGESGEGAGYLPFWIGGERLGNVRHDLHAALLGAGAVEEAEVGLRLRDEGFSSPRRSRLLQGLAVQLRSAGLIGDWRNELCSVLNAAGDEVARCERGAFRTLGIQNRAVHVNGYLADGRIWVARRSQLKRADPGMLDNVAAGGVSAGESLRSCASCGKRRACRANSPPAWCSPASACARCARRASACTTNASSSPTCCCRRASCRSAATARSSISSA